MNESELRLECLQLAIGQSHQGDDAVGLAAKFYDFIRDRRSESEKLSEAMIELQNRRGPSRTEMLSKVARECQAVNDSARATMVDEARSR